MPEIKPDTLYVTPGRPFPFGATVYNEGVRFTIFSRHASRVWLALFNHIEDRQPAWEFEYDAKKFRTGDVWSVFVRGVSEGVLYKYRMDGPYDHESGHRFNPDIYLLDPYARAIVGNVDDGTLKGVAAHDYMDWSYDRRPHTPMEDSIIYETHVRGFTRHESSGADNNGTYKGLIEKIPYLKDLGITAVELLPVQEFGETKLGRKNLDGEELINYWGYSNIGFFAPAGRYACSNSGLEHLAEFREMVNALHKAGIEVILDVVFNHTSEGDDRGPTLCFRGIDNTIYYLLDKGEYLNYTGCGNTVNCNHPLVRDFIMNCLRYWVAVMHIDGFRFDLASILGRDQNGEVLQDAPLIERIGEDPVLRDTKLIAEAWDAGGAYQVGSFGNGDVRWAEWNGRYRDDVRRYWRGEENMRGAFAARITGSADVYQWASRTPEHSINFVTCHDGFTLRDLVSYNQKHNEMNGEDNRDGADENYSFNCGAEGETDDSEINALRCRMQKNYLATLFLSIGVPMLLGGDEFGRTQLGNNNAYCQDNEISWFDWQLLDKNQDLHRFCREMIAYRKAQPVLRRNAFFKGITDPAHPENADILWFDEKGGQPDWSAAESALACRIHYHQNKGLALCLLFNNSGEEKTFTLPGGTWKRRVYTAAESPEDIITGEQEPPALTGEAALAPRSLMVLESV
jgi:isoamylase